MILKNFITIPEIPLFFGDKYDTISVKMHAIPKKPILEVVWV